MCAAANSWGKSLLTSPGICSPVFGVVRTLETSTCSFDTVTLPTAAIETAGNAGDAILTAIDTAFNIIDPLRQPVEDVFDQLESFVEVFTPIKEALDPYTGIIDSLYDVFKYFDCGVFCDAVDKSLEEAFDLILKPILDAAGTNLTTIVNDILDEIGIELPSFGLDALGEDFLTPLTNVAESLTSQLNSIIGLLDWSNFDTTAELNAALASCDSKGAWPVRVATAYDDASISLDCSSESRPVISSADYSRGSCSQDYSGIYRFPCDSEQDSSACAIDDYPSFSRCPPDLEPDGLPSDLDPNPVSSTVFQISYFCINKNEDPEILSKLNIWNTDGIVATRRRQSISGNPMTTVIGEPFPITGLASRKFDESPRHPREVKCSGDRRIDVDARSNYIRKCYGSDYYDKVDEFTKYRQDLCVVDLLRYDEDTEGNFGRGQIGTPTTRGEYPLRADPHSPVWLDTSMSCSIDGTCSDASDEDRDKKWIYRDAHMFAFRQIADSDQVEYVCSLCPAERIAAGTCEDFYCPCPTFAINFDSCPSATRLCSPRTGTIFNVPYDEACPQYGSDFDARAAEVIKREMFYNSFYEDFNSNECDATWDGCHGSKSCNLVGCELDYFHWACVDPYSNIQNAQVTYHYSDTVNTTNGKLITCPTNQEVIILKAEFGVGFTIKDVTVEVQALCAGSFDCTVNAKDVAIRLNVSPIGNTLRVESICNCVAGYDVLPVQGTCTPCAVGKVRPDFYLFFCKHIHDLIANLLPTSFVQMLTRRDPSTEKKICLNVWKFLLVFTAAPTDLEHIRVNPVLLVIPLVVAHVRTVLSAFGVEQTVQQRV